MKILPVEAAIILIQRRITNLKFLKKTVTDREPGPSLPTPTDINPKLI